jgi:hypothetical protein
LCSRLNKRVSERQARLFSIICSILL